MSDREPITLSARPSRHQLIAAAIVSMAAIETPIAFNDGSPNYYGAKWAPVTPASDRQPRNWPCPCGSGKKFKKCCRGKKPSVKKGSSCEQTPANQQ